MKIILYMASTINGFVAGPDDDTSWVKDLDALNEAIADAKVVIMGRRTYEESKKYGDFPYKGAFNIVLTRNEQLQKQSTDTVLFTADPIDIVINSMIDKKFEKLLLIGGGTTNGEFMKLGIIDEIILDVHPFVLSHGIKLFEDEFDSKQLRLLETKSLNNQITQLRYAVINDEFAVEQDETSKNE